MARVGACRWLPLPFVEVKRNSQCRSQLSVRLQQPLRESGDSIALHPGMLCASPPTTWWPWRRIEAACESDSLPASSSGTACASMAEGTDAMPALLIARAPPSRPDANTELEAGVTASLPPPGGYVVRR